MERQPNPVVFQLYLLLIIYTPLEKRPSFPGRFSLSIFVFIPFYDVLRGLNAVQNALAQ